MQRSARGTVSVLESSLCECSSLEASTFCVVCGRFGTDLVLRRSGLKCAGCVGKSANRQWVRLQHRQAHELLSRATASARTRQLRIAGLSSAAEGRCDSSTLDSDGLSSLRPVSARPGEMRDMQLASWRRRRSLPSSRLDATGEERAGQPHIREYIANTACYQAAAAGLSVQEALGASRNDSTGSSKAATPGKKDLSEVQDTVNALTASFTSVQGPKTSFKSPLPRLSSFCKEGGRNKKRRLSSTINTLKEETHSTVLFVEPAPLPARPSYRSDTVVEAAEATVIDDTEADLLDLHMENLCPHEGASLPEHSRQSRTSVLREQEAPKSANVSPHESEAYVPPPTPGVCGSSAAASLRERDAQECAGHSVFPTGQGEGPPPPMFAVSKSAQRSERKAAEELRVITPVAVSKVSQEAQWQPLTCYVDPTTRHFSRSDRVAPESVASSLSSAASLEPGVKGLSASLKSHDGTGDVPIVNLDRLWVSVEFVQSRYLSEDLLAISSSRGVTGHAASGGTNTINSTSSGMTGSRVSSPLGNKFTVTRHFLSGYSKQESSVSTQTAHSPSRRVATDGSSATRRQRGNAPERGTTRAKKISFLFVVRDKDTNHVISTVKRRYFIEIISVFQELKTIMYSLPALPSRRAPGTRRVTATYVAELRENCQIFIDAVAQNHFLIRHPKVMNLLQLESPMCQSGAPLQSRLQQLQQPPPQREQPQLPKGLPPKAVSSAMETQGLGKSVLDDRALQQLFPTSSEKAFSRMGSTVSCASNASSIVRRGAMDAVSVEDLERVQLGNLIGRGAFGTVYLGLLSGSSAVVAVKVVQVNENVEKGFLLSLQKELDVLRAARHKNIIRFLGSTYLEPKRELRVFTEYVECGNVPSMVRKFGCLPLSVIQKYMTEILCGLHYLHEMAIVHRDIKGENILITKNGCCKLADFGCSGTLQEVEGHKGIQGSPLWLAPEIIYGASPATSGDIWALGCVGIEMLQRAMWHMDSNMNPYIFLYRVGKCNTPPHGLPTEEELETFNKEGTRDEYQSFKLYRDFLCRCLCMNPEERWSALELRKHPFLHTPFSKRLRWMPPNKELNEESV